MPVRPTSEHVGTHYVFPDAVPYAQFRTAETPAEAGLFLLAEVADPSDRYMRGNVRCRKANGSLSDWIWYDASYNMAYSADEVGTIMAVARENDPSAGVLLYSPRHPDGIDRQPMALTLRDTEWVYQDSPLMRRWVEWVTIHACPRCRRVHETADGLVGNGCIYCMVMDLDGNPLATNERVTVRLADGTSVALHYLRVGDDMLDDGRRRWQECSDCYTTVETIGLNDDRRCVTCVGRYRTCEYCDESYVVEQYYPHVCEYARVRGYSYRPTPNFRGEGPLFMGFELETESKGEWSTAEGAQFAGSLSERGDLFYMKHDGSLSDGFEIVTHPMSLQFAMAEFPWHLLDGLREHDFRSWDTTSCGLHVHMSRDAFNGADHLLKFLLVAYKSQDKLVRLSGRRSDRWASWSSESDDHMLTRKAEGAGGLRYCAINTNNRATIEMRFFRGSLNPGQVKMALQWCHALWEYTASCDMDSLTWAEFRSFVSDNAERFADLEERIAVRVGGEGKSFVVVPDSDYDLSVQDDSDPDDDDPNEHDEECGCYDCLPPDDEYEDDDE